MATTRAAAALPYPNTAPIRNVTARGDLPTVRPFRRPLLLLALVGLAAGCGDDGPTAPAEQTLDPATLVASATDGEPGQPTHVVVEARDTEGQPFPGPLPGLQLEIRGENPGTVTEASNNGDGTFTLSYTPTALGFDTLIATLDGSTISGTPVASRVRTVWVAASGTAGIDGMVSPGEWDAAEEYIVFGGPTLTGTTVQFMADATNLYILVSYPDSVGSASIRFDNTLDFVLAGDDLISGGTYGFSDRVHGESGYTRDEVSHGEAAGTFTSTSSVVEISHPLDSGDPQDIAVGGGARLGVCLSAGMNGTAGDISEPGGCTLLVTKQERYAELQLP